MLEFKNEYKEEVCKRFSINSFECNILQFVYGKVRDTNIKKPFITSCLIAKIFHIDRHKSDRVLKKLVDNELLTRTKKLKKRYYEYFINAKLIRFFNELINREEEKEQRLNNLTNLYNKFMGRDKQEFNEEDKQEFNKKFGGKLTKIKYGNI